VAAPVFSYVVLMEFAKPGMPSVTIESKQDAYTIDDAWKQALYEIDGQHGYASNGYTMRVLAIKPDIERTISAMQSIAEKIGLLRAPTQGSKS
jgi:hypothetical protein